MKRIILSSVLAAAAASLSAAEPKDDVKAAISGLSDTANYSWVTTVDMPGMPFHPGPTKGKTEKGGFTLLTQDMDGETIEAALKGDKGAVKTADGWKASSELPQFGPPPGGGPPGGGPPPDGQGGPPGGGPPGGGPPPGGQGGFSGGPPPGGGPPGDGGPPPGFDPATMMGRMLLNTKLPAIQAADVLGKTKSLASDDGVISGDLTEDGAKDLLRFGPRRGGGRGPSGPGAGGPGFGPPEPQNAKGSAKFWLKDGALTKYVVHVEGTMSFGGDDRQIERTTTVEIKDAGSTKVEIPDEAQKKLAL
jgi:hypothetical protein